MMSKVGKMFSPSVHRVVLNKPLRGIVSAVRVLESGFKSIQTDAAISPEVVAVAYLMRRQS